MKTSLRPLMTLLVLLAGSLYVFAIVWAGIISIQGGGTLNSLMSQLAVVIGGILSTNFGAVLGITLTAPKEAVKPSFLGLKPTIEKPDKDVSSSNTDANQKSQIIACWVYVISLVVACGFWIATHVMGRSESALPLLSELTQTLIGVLAGVMVVQLGTK